MQSTQLCLSYPQSYRRVLIFDVSSCLFFGLNHSFTVAVNQLQLPPQRHCVCFITATPCLFNDSILHSNTSHYYGTVPRLTPVNLVNLLTNNYSMNDSVTFSIISRAVYSFRLCCLRMYVVAAMRASRVFTSAVVLAVFSMLPWAD